MSAEGRFPAPARLLTLFALFVAVSVATRWFGLLVDVLDIDETAHIVGAWEVLRGRVLYAEFVNNKPPLLYAYYVLAQMVAPDTLIGVRLFTTVVTVPLTALAVSAFYDHDRRGVVAGLLFLIYSAAFLAHDMLATHAEILMTLPGLWAVAIVRDERRAQSAWRLAMAGVLLGVGVLLKYQVGIWLCALIVAVGWTSLGPRPGAWPHTWRAAAKAGALLLAGFVVPLVVTWLAFARVDAADDLIYWTLRNNAAYVANPIPWREAGERFGSNALPFFIVTLPLWWGAWRARHQHGSSYRDLLIVLLIATTVPAVFVGWRFFPHYFIQFYGPLALAAAPWAEPLLRRPLPAPGRRLAAWSAVVLVVATVVNIALYFGPWRVYREIDPIYRQIAARLERDACHDNATLFVWGHAPVFYYHARLAAASRFVVMAQARLTLYVSGNLTSLRGDIEEGGEVVPNTGTGCSTISRGAARLTCSMPRRPASTAGTATRCGTTRASNRGCSASSRRSTPLRGWTSTDGGVVRRKTDAGPGARSQRRTRNHEPATKDVHETDRPPPRRPCRGRRAPQRWRRRTPSRARGCTRSATARAA